MRMTDNPFESPTAELVDAPPPASEATASDEATRRELLKHEASILAIGRLMRLGALFMGLVALSMLAAGVATDESPGVMTGIAVVYGGLAVVSGWCGTRLRNLDPRGRVPAAVFNGIGLIGFPIGTLVSGYILYLLLSERGRRVLSIEYQGIVARTPHIRYRTPVVVLVVAALLITFAVAAVVMARL